MEALTSAEVLDSFVNCSKGEAKRINSVLGSEAA